MFLSFYAPPSWGCFCVENFALVRARFLTPPLTCGFAVGVLAKNPKTRTRCENDICAGRYPRIYHRFDTLFPAAIVQ